MVRPRISVSCSLAVLAPTLCVVEALCIGACASSATSGAKQPIAVDRSASDPPPRESAPEPDHGTWQAPRLPLVAAPATRWVNAEVPATCRTLSPGSLTPLQSEADFEDTFCRKSNLDWNRYTLYVYVPPASEGRTLFSRDVVRDEGQLRWVLQPAGCASSAWQGAAPLGVLLEHSDLPLSPVLIDAATSNCATPDDGYPY
jgi:hypothetical protein